MPSTRPHGLRFPLQSKTGGRPVEIIMTSGLHKTDIGKLPVEGRFISKPYDPVMVVSTIREMVSPA